MNSSSSELWEEELSYSYKVEGERCCRQLVGIFEEAHIDYFGLEASFMQEYQLAEFEAEWAAQNSGKKAKEYKGLKRRGKYYLQRPQDYPHEFIMDIGEDPVRGMVFMEVYREELERMKEEYQIRISTNGLKLYIFMRQKEELNIICKTRLLDMNRGLRIFYGHEENLVFIINVSYLLRKQLLERGIHVWFKHVVSHHHAVFFSVSLDINQMLPIIQDITQFDISVFSLLHPSVTELEAASVKAVVYEALLQDIATIQAEYEVGLEFSEDNCYIVFHTKHAIFGAEPVAVFQKRLNSLVILSVKSSNIKEFDNRLRKFIKEAPFVSEVMNNHRNETYVAVDLARVHGAARDGRQVEEFLQLFLLLVEPDFELKVYLNHLTGDLEESCRRLVAMFEEHNLIVKNHAFQECSERKAVLQFKDLSQSVLAKRQKDLLLFLHALLSLPPTEHSQPAAFLDDPSLLSLTSSSHILNVSRSEESIVEERFELPWLKLQYAAPAVRVFVGEERHYLKNRRKRDLEDLFNAQSSFKFKVWSLQLSSDLPIPGEGLAGKPYLFREMFRDCKISEAGQLATLNSFQLKEEGAIGFTSDAIALPVVPLFLFERIQ